MKGIPAAAKYYIWLHALASLYIIYSVSMGSHEVSFPFILPFILFGCLFEILRLSAFTVNKEEFNISAGAAIILAAIVLFNPLELIIFATCYGISVVSFPRIQDFTKVVFNICETINVTYISYMVWNALHNKSESLLDVNSIIPLLVTMFVFVILDLLAVSSVIALSSGERLFKIWKDSLDWVIVSYGLIAFIGLILAAVYQTFALYGLIGFVIPLLLMRFNMYLFSKEKDTQLKNLQKYSSLLAANNDQLIMTLSEVIDARDNSLFGHSAAVAKYANAIGRKLNLSEEEIYDLNRGSLLHDMGKLGISEAILQKPGKLNAEEFETIKKHTIIGEKILNNIAGMEKIAPIVGQHHEYFNGQGYPRRLSSQNILIQSRIVSLCDALDTMLSSRPYKKAWSLEETAAELLRCSGSQFDPMIVEAFLQIRKELGDDFFSNSSLIKKKGSILKDILSNAAEN